MDITLIAITIFILIAIVFLVLFLFKSINKKSFTAEDGSIFDNQADLDDEITLSYAGSNRVTQIVDIDTKRGGQVYLFIILVRF